MFELSYPSASTWSSQLCQCDCIPALPGTTVPCGVVACGVLRSLLGARPVKVNTEVVLYVNSTVLGNFHIRY